MPPAARPLTRGMLGWALLVDSLPLYPLYALLFADSGLSDAQISGLFAIWSTVGFVAEVPSGALADRFGRRRCLVVAALLQAVGFAVWTAWPSFVGFALGFVLWGLGGALTSGSREALLYDGLVAVGAEAEYVRVNGWVSAATLLAGLPAAGGATVLYAVGGYELAGWTSVGVLLVASVLAARLPEPAVTDDGAATVDPGYRATLRAGLVAAAARAGLPALLVAVALVDGFDAIEEYFGLVTAGLEVPTGLVPVAMLPITLVGALGAGLGGRVGGLRPIRLALLLGAGMGLLAAVSLVPHPVALAGVAVFYGTYRAVVVVVDARLQQRIDSRCRATVTSVAALGSEVSCFAVYGAWGIGGLPATAAFGLLLAAALPWLLAVPSRVATR